jgi:hypothetical protein
MKAQHILMPPPGGEDTANALLFQGTNRAGVFGADKFIGAEQGVVEVDGSEAIGKQRIGSLG